VMMENVAVCSRERWKLPWFMTFLLNSPASCRHGDGGGSRKVLGCCWMKVPRV